VERGVVRGVERGVEGVVERGRMAASAWWCMEP